MRKLAAFGFGLVALMQLIFLVNSGDRAFPYKEVQALAMAGTIAIVWGIATGRDVVLIVGLAVNLFTRILQPLLGVTRLPMWATAILVIGWTWALASTMRGRDARIGIWILAIGHFLSMLTAMARTASVIALGIGAIGLFLTAPNFRRGSER